MIAMLMAAGNGMRLRPITDNVQKCLLPVMGVPMLEWWLNASFESGAFEKVYVNVHYMAEDVMKWLKRYEERTGRRVSLIDERNALLGTAKTIRALQWAESGSDFMVAYTDTYSEHVLENLRFYADLWSGQRAEVMAGLISFNPPNDGSASAIALDSIGRVVDFKEKADHGDVSWMGTMFGRPEFFEKIVFEDKDLAKDVFPRMAASMRVIAHVEAYDIGRGVEQYERIKNGFAKR